MSASLAAGRGPGAGMRVGVTPTAFGAVRDWPAGMARGTVNLVGTQSRIAMRYVANEARAMALVAGIAGLLVAGAAPAGSEIFRCVESGRVTYADRQCGESSVVVVVTSPHRRAAFEACQYAIDTLKKIVPIWKKEFFEDGAVWVQGEAWPEEVASEGPREGDAE